MARRTKAASTATKLQTPVGANAKPEVAAAAPGEAEAKVGEDKIVAPAVDPAGAGGAPAASPEQSRETADAAATDRKGAADEGTQPGGTSRPSVAGLMVKVRSRRPQGRRRAGIAFGAEPIAVDTAALSPLQLDGLLNDPELIIEDAID